MEDKVSIELYQRQRGDALVHEAKSIVITDDKSRKHAAEFLLNCVAFEKAVDEWLGPDIENANKVHKSLTKKRSELKGMAKTADEIVRAEIKRDYLEVEAGRLKDQERINEQTQKLAAELGEWTPDVILPETEKRITTEVGYTTIRKDTSVTVASKIELIRAVASGALPLTFLEPDMGMIKKWVVAGGVKQAPGLSIKDDAIIVAKKS